MKFKIKEIMRLSKNQLSCYITLFDNFAPYDQLHMHALRRMVFFNTVAVIFQIPLKKKNNNNLAKLVVLVSSTLANDIVF